jgi:hypothetical protein
MLKSNLVTNKKLVLKKYDTGWGGINVIFNCVIPLNILMVEIHGYGYIPIKDSPHFKFAQFLLGDKQGQSKPYINYITEHYPSEDLDKTISNFKTTLRFALDKPESVVILVTAIKKSDYFFTIIDGVHRTAILAALDRPKIRCFFRF